MSISNGRYIDILVGFIAEAKIKAQIELSIILILLLLRLSDPKDFSEAFH